MAAVETDVTMAPAAPIRLASLDVYRGLTMLLLAFTVPSWSWQESIAEANPWLRPLMDQFEHAAWRGLTLWDLIQPSFMFMVGVSLAYSYASRKRRGASNSQLWQHAAYRAVMLVLLGVFLRSVGSDATNWTLEDVVTQIGLGYLPLYWLATRSESFQATACALVLVVFWGLFALWPIPTADFNAEANAAVLHYDGFWAHWNQNTGPGHRFDQWLLNLFPRDEPFMANGEGYNTLNFVPSLVTMTLGLIAGQRLRGKATPVAKPKTPVAKLKWLVYSGFVLLLIGVVMDLSGVCPMVKKLWTPSFTLASGGLCLLVLASLYWVIDLKGWRRWAWPAEVVGRNPLAMYIMTWTLAGWLLMNLNTHLGQETFEIVGEAYGPMLGNFTVGLLLFLICWWMDRNRVYVRL